MRQFSLRSRGPKFFNSLSNDIQNAASVRLFKKTDVTNTGNGERGTVNGERGTGTGNGEPGTGVWELMYSGNPLENSKWRSKQKKGSKRNNLG